jgi:hydroxymethylglutaryl-CoA lyase
MLSDMGVETGIDLAGLLEAARLAESLVGHPLPGRVLKAGPRRPSEIDPRSAAGG